MIKETLLRDYQLEMLDRLNQAWLGITNPQQRSILVQMPTGVGKTHLMAEVIKNEELRIKNEESGTKKEELTIGCENYVLVVAHRIELIDQISRTLDKFGIEHGLIINRKPIDETKQVQVASIQTLARRLEPLSDSSKMKRLSFEYTPSLIIIDEAHHALAKTYKML